MYSLSLRRSFLPSPRSLSQKPDVLLLATAQPCRQGWGGVNIWFALLKLPVGSRRKGRRPPGTTALHPVPLCLSLYAGRSRSFNRKKNPCFDSSGKRSALRCPFLVVCMGAWLLGLVTANFVSLTGRKQRGLSPAAQGGRGVGCADVAGCGAAVAPQAAVVFPLPLCKGTAGFSTSGGQGVAPSWLEHCGLKA